MNLKTDIFEGTSTYILKSLSMRVGVGVQLKDYESGTELFKKGERMF